jgi:hypothetical protein
MDQLVSPITLIIYEYLYFKDRYNLAFCNKRLSKLFKLASSTKRIFRLKSGFKNEWALPKVLTILRQYPKFRFRIQLNAFSKKSLYFLENNTYPNIEEITFRDSKRNSPLNSVQNITNIPNLLSLEISGFSKLKSLEGIEKLTKLQKIRLVSQKNMDLSSICGVSDVRIEGCQELDLSCLETFTGTFFLQSCKKITGFSGLKNCQKITISSYVCNCGLQTDDLYHFINVPDLSIIYSHWIKNVSMLNNAKTLDIRGLHNLKNLNGLQNVGELIMSKAIYSDHKTQIINEKFKNLKIPTNF